MGVPDSGPQTGRRSGVTGSILRSSGMMFVYQGLVIVLGFALQVMLARKAGTEVLGGYTLLVTWLGILAVVTVPGVEATLVYFLPRLDRDPAAQRKLLRFSLAMVALLSAAAGTLVLSGWSGLLGRIGLPAQARVPLSMAVVLFSLGKLQDAVFLGRMATPLIGLYNVVRALLRLLFCLPVIWFPQRAWDLVFQAVVVECLLTLALRQWRIRRGWPEATADAGALGLQVRGILAILAPMFGISIIDTLFPFLDKALLGAMLPLALLGVYRVAESIASLNTIFVSPFMAFWPYISKLYQEDRLEELREAYSTITLLILALMVPAMLVLVECGGAVLGLFGADVARDGIWVLLILASASFVDAMAGPAGAVLKMTRHSRLSFWINMALLGLYLVLSFLWTRAYGILGAACAKAAVTILGNLANITANRLLLGISPYHAVHGVLLTVGGLILLARPWLALPAEIPCRPFLGAGLLVALYGALTALLLRKRIPEFRLRLQELIRSRAS